MATMSEATEAPTETVAVAAVTKMAVEVVVAISAVTRTASEVTKGNASDKADEATVVRLGIPTSGNGHDAQAE